MDDSRHKRDVDQGDISDLSADIAASQSTTDGNTDQVPLGPYPTPPSQSQLEPIRQAIRETGMPELVPELEWSKPDKTLKAVLYHPMISVKRSLRIDGDMIPCPFCSPDAPKFLNFYLLWSADGYLRIVGNDCGPNHFGQPEFHQMAKDAKRRADHDSNINYLTECLPVLDRWLADLDRLEPICRKLHLQQLAFRKDVPRLYKALERQRRDHGGALDVVRKKTQEGPGGMRSSTGGQSEYETELVAHLIGGEFLKTSSNPEAKLSKIRGSIVDIVGGRQLPLTDDDILEIVIALDDADDLADVRKSLEAAQRQTASLHEQVREAAAFLGDANLDGMQKWGAHDHAELHFQIKRDPGRVRFEVRWDEFVVLSRANMTVPNLNHIMA